MLSIYIFAHIAYILQLANRQDIPVISGATKPLTEEITTYYPEIHGAEGLGAIHVPENILSIQYIQFWQYSLRFL